MSVSFYTYIGPYIKVCNPLRQDTEEIYSCLNLNCLNHKLPVSWKYCPRCGQEVKCLNVPKSKKLYFDVYLECNEKLASVGEHYYNEDVGLYIPNQGELGRHIDSTNNIIPVDISMIQKEKEDFIFNFIDEILKIKTFFGELNVEINWGVLTYNC